ncbi:MAG TPA: SufS family cysteine desulfurase [Acholeplasmataceae bacterium]|jgi:cysteine desulfurase/selenocysteine lyase|nr:SufS family cysteine desulfurase [Acholeplasmataceae bacterium]
MFAVKKIREYFPIYKKYPNLVYLDSGATSLKPQPVLDKMNEYYSEYGVNIHRGVYELSFKATDEYDKAREKVAKFINAKPDEIIFTANVTDALNKLALMYAKDNIKTGDVVLTSELEHHSSLLPWMKICEEKQAELRYIPLNREGRITVENFNKSLDEKVKVVALTYVSNVMGYRTPLEEIIPLAHQNKSVVIVDAAQAVHHFKVDVKALDCDFLAFSGHKMLGPTGIGVLYGKKRLLKTLAPVFYGGDMNQDVYVDHVEIKEVPYCFEAGTPPIAEALGLGRAIDFLEEIGLENIEAHCQEIYEYTLEKLSKIKGITVYNKTADIPIITFNVNGVHPHDAATCFDQNEICIRAGHHCAQLVSKFLKCTGTLRASIYLYNDKSDIDRFVDTLQKTIELFRKLDGE